MIGNPILSQLRAFRARGIGIICLLLALAFFSPALFAQDTQPAGVDSQAGAAEVQAETASPAETTASAETGEPAAPAESGSTESVDLQPVDRGAPPEALRRPERGEAPRYPQDIVIGELGQGKAPEAAYQYALKLVQTLMAGTKDAPVITDSPLVLTDTLLDEINSLEPRSYRLGGGRVEDDGNVSFLVRFLGQDESITGEMFLRQAQPPAPAATSAPADTSVSAETPAPGVSAPGPENSQPAASDSPAEDKWLLDDLILEDKVNLNDIKDSYRYDFSPYERLY